MSDIEERHSTEEAEPLVIDSSNPSPRVSGGDISGIESCRPATGEHNDPKANSRIRPWLFCSHLLSTWNSRVFEFGAVLFLAEIFPDTLRPVSAYTLLRAISVICLSPTVGEYIDQGNRLDVVRKSIVGQRVSVISSCLLFGIMVGEAVGHPSVRAGLFGLLCVLACLEKVCSVMNLIAVERDWVVTIADNTELDLQTLNSQMRRIDLACKLFGPLAIALLDGLSTKGAIYGTLGLSASCVSLEYYSIAKV